MLAMILGYFTKAALVSVAGKLWKGFCDFIATPVGAAVVAGGIMFCVGVAHEHHVWEVRWAAAVKAAEQARIQRDADIAAQVKKDADSRLAALATRKDELEQKVKEYEDQEAQQRAVGNAGGPCSPLTDKSDARWLRDAQRKAISGANAHRGFALRLRTLGH